MADPLPTNYADGQTVRASHVNAIGQVVNGLARDVSGFLPTGEVIIQSASSGLLSQRPDAVSLQSGSIYTATDELVVYVAHDGDWIKVAPTDSGRILASANPTSAATLSMPTPGTFYRVPELTTASFTMPATTCTVSMGKLAVANVSVAGLSMQIRYTTDGWSTSKICASNSEASFASNTSVFDPVVCRLAETVTLTPPAAGAAVQVAAFLGHGSDTSVSPFISHALFSVVCLLEVRAG
jgi:hypothetical protein